MKIQYGHNQWCVIGQPLDNKEEDGDDPLVPIAINQYLITLIMTTDQYPYLSTNIAYIPVHPDNAVAASIWPEDGRNEE